jgi:uncharacterized ferritin-like protein (DUF455 family)
VSEQTSVAAEEWLADGPAREPHIIVRDRWSQCVNLEEGHPDKVKEFLHRQLNEETNVLENAARNLADFPDADWEIRMWLARQCADEARHVLAYRKLLHQRGGVFGDYPVINFQYKLLGRIPTLEGRLAVQNRTFEADGLDAAVFGAGEARATGDHELADIFEAQAADEILHVRFANDWIKTVVKQTPRAVLEIARALTLGSRAFEWVFAHGGTDVTKYPVAEDARLRAGFDSSEVAVSAEMSRARRDEILRRHP